jgi:hypothetical protein
MKIKSVRVTIERAQDGPQYAPLSIRRADDYEPIEFTVEVHEERGGTWYQRAHLPAKVALQMQDNKSLLEMILQRTCQILIDKLKEMD